MTHSKNVLKTPAADKLGLQNEGWLSYKKPSHRNLTKSAQLLMNICEAWGAISEAELLDQLKDYMPPGSAKHIIRSSLKKLLEEKALIKHDSPYKWKLTPEISAFISQRQSLPMDFFTETL